MDRDPGCEVMVWLGIWNDIKKCYYIQMSGLTGFFIRVNEIQLMCMF